MFMFLIDTRSDFCFELFTNVDIPVSIVHVQNTLCVGNSRIVITNYCPESCVFHALPYCSLVFFLSSVCLSFEL